MDEKAVFFTDLEGYLSDRLKEGLRLDIAYRAAYLGDNDVGVGLFGYGIDEILYLVGDVRNDLHGGAEIFASALFIEHVPINFTGGEV